MTVIDLKTMREVSPPPLSVLCLGNFDGVHLGHVALVNHVKQKKQELEMQFENVASGACFFRVPPSHFLLESPPPQLITFEHKLRIFAELGIEYAYVMDFEHVGAYSPEDFVKSVLQEAFHCIFAVCGFDFRFGKNASGNAETLRTLMNDAVSVISPICANGQIVSSSILRQRITDGDVHLVPALLGRPYCIEAEVIHGKALGRTLGSPTVNQYFPGNLAVPKLGIYITKTLIDGIVYPSVTNVGTRPTVEHESRINCETHILDFEKDLYGQYVTVQFIQRLRDEMKFESVENLQSQIQKDIQATREYYKEA